MNRQQRRAAQQKGRHQPAPTPAQDGLSAQGRTLLNLAIAHHRKGELGKAEPLYRQVLELTPDSPITLNHLGLILKEKQQLAQAAELIGKAIRLQPGYAEAHNNLGTIYKVLERWDDAQNCFQKAVSLNRNYGQAHYNLGSILQVKKEYTAALASYKAAVKLEPGFAEAHNNMGLTLRYLGRTAEALKSYRQALLLKPSLADAHSNLGSLLRPFIQFQPAMRCFERATALDPTLIAARYNLGTCNLQAGQLSKGWPLYDLRFAMKKETRLRQVQEPRWRGEDISDKRILAWREQGVGDELLFGTCLPDLIARAGHVILECDARLVPIFQRSLPAMTVRPADSLATSLPDADTHIPLGGLPEYFRSRLEDFPDNRGYLRADPARMAYWKRYVDGLGDGLKVGICWRSRYLSKERRASYMALDSMKPVLQVPGVQFVNMQYDDCADELQQAEKAFGCTIHVAPGLDLQDDLDGAAALTANLDLVITAGTSVGDMAGALGIPVWRFGHDNDWTKLGSDHRPWFKSMRLFYRRENIFWTTIVDQMRDALMGCVADPAALRAERARAFTWSEPLPPSPANDPLPVLGYDEKKNPHFHAAGNATAPLGQSDIEILTLMGRADSLFQNGDFMAALEFYQAILAKDPAHTGALFGAANVAKETRQYEQAAALYEIVLNMDRSQWTVGNNLASTLRLLGRYDEAIEIYREILTGRPEEARLWLNLGATLAQRQLPGDNENARIFFEEAVRLDPSLAAAHTNLAMNLLWAGEAERSLEHYRIALDLDPDRPELRFSYALSLLSLGRLDEGWQAYESRLAPGSPKAITYTHGLPRWQGEDLAGRDILVSGEQGLGDQLVFASCLPDLIARAGKVVLDIEPRLVNLFQRAFPEAEIHPAVTGQENGRLLYRADWLSGRARKPDVAVPIGSLPLYLRTRIEDFPASGGYLTADPVRVAGWREKLAALGDTVKIGICWRSGLMTPERRSQYTDLMDWTAIFALPNVSFVNLQYDDCLQEIRQAEQKHGITIQSFPDLDQRNDLDGVAGLISALDFVISAPTAVQALAGALGVPTILVRNHWMMLGTQRFPLQPSVTPIHRGADGTPVTVNIARYLAPLVSRP